MPVNARTMRTSAKIRINGLDIEISPTGHFGSGDMDRLVRCAFAHEDTDLVRIEPLIRRIRIRLAASTVDRRASLARLADLMLQKTILDKSLPKISGPKPITYKRWRGVVTTLIIEGQTLGQICVMVPREISERIVVESIQRLQGLPGVHQVITARYSRRIIIGYDPNVDQTIWVRALERTLCPAVNSIESPESPEIRSLMPNINLVFCSLGQFFYPPAIPFVSGVLLLSRIPQFSKAGRELRRGKIGASFYRSVVVACSVAAMAPFASALAEWLSIHWERRVDRILGRQSLDLIATLPPATALPVPGDRNKSITLVTGDLVPMDGELTQGELLIRDGIFTDPSSAPLIRKQKGDGLSSGYQVIGGYGVLQPLDDGHEDRLHSIIRYLAELPIRLAEDDYLREEACRMGDLSVYPNLALAGVAYSMGGLPMVGAVMNQDWMASPKIAAPTEFFRDLRMGLEHGAMIRTPAALKGLAETSVLLIEANYPGLSDLRPRVTGIESDHKLTSRANSWASVLADWVGDARSEALRDIAQISNNNKVDSRFVGFEAGKTELMIDGQRVILEDLPGVGEWPSLCIKVDGEPSETLRFESTNISQLARTVGRLRSLGIVTAVYGSGAAQVGPVIGADAIYPDIDNASLAKFMQELKHNGYSSSLVASQTLETALVGDAPVIIGPLNHVKGLEVPTIELLGDSLDGLPDLVLVARTLELRIGWASARSIPANLLCIIGAFSGIFNGVMTTVIAHSGVLGVSLIQDRRMKQPKRKGAIPLS